MTLDDHDLRLRPATEGEVEFFFATRRTGFRAYAEEVFGPWDEARQRAAAELEIGRASCRERV